MLKTIFCFISEDYTCYLTWIDKNKITKEKYKEKKNFNVDDCNIHFNVQKVTADEYQ